MMELSDAAWKRFERRSELAERKYEREVDSARETDIGVVGIDPYDPWERRDIVDNATKQACLRFWGSLFFFFLDELSSQQLSVDELRQQVNQALVVLRKEVMQTKWPNPRVPGRGCQERKEQEFDCALIEWLEARKQWQRYEARIRPELAVPAVPCDSGQESSTPLMYFLAWPLDGLSADTRRALRSDLLQIHGSHLDGTIGYVECCRLTYDLIAGKFDPAGLLSEEVLQRSIPEMVADASDGGGWSAEPMGRTEPTAIFNVRLGSQFYPPWRVEALLESLEGRISHWSGRLLLNPSFSLDGGSRRGRRPQSEEHRRVASMVESLGGNWRSDPEKLLQLAERMDLEGVPLDKRSRMKGVESWLDKHEGDPVNFIKTIKYRLRRAKK